MAFVCGSQTARRDLSSHLEVSGAGVVVALGEWRGEGWVPLPIVDVSRHLLLGEETYGLVWLYGFLFAYPGCGVKLVGSWLGTR